MSEERSFKGPVDNILELKKVDDFFVKVTESGSLRLIAAAFVFDADADKRTPDALDHRVQIALTLEQANQLMKLLGAVLFDAES